MRTVRSAHFLRHSLRGTQKPAPSLDKTESVLKVLLEPEVVLLPASLAMLLGFPSLAVPRVKGERCPEGALGGERECSSDLQHLCWPPPGCQAC